MPYTWALLRWWFTTKRRYIKCMHLYLLAWVRAGLQLLLDFHLCTVFDSAADGDCRPRSSDGVDRFQRDGQMFSDRSSDAGHTMDQVLRAVGITSSGLFYHRLQCSNNTNTNTRTIFIVLSSWPQGHCESSLGSSDECRTAPSGRRPSDQATWLGLWVRL